MRARDPGCVFEPLTIPAVVQESASDPYVGVALGVECAWPVNITRAPGLPTEAQDPIPSSSP